MPDQFDPRGKENRALLVGVPEYAFAHVTDGHGVPGDLKAVHHNLSQLHEVLRNGNIFEPNQITVCRPDGVDDFTKELNDAVESAEGLLLFYFAGHGAIPSAADELWLQMRNARVVAGAAAVFQGSQPWSQVLGTLSSSHAEEIVIVLDCCNAGNAALVWEALPHKQHISQLMSVQANNRIDAGTDEEPTPFTGQLIRILENGIGGAGGDVGFHALSEELRAYLTEHYMTMRPEPWEPQSRPGTSGRDVLLATDLPADPPEPETEDKTGPVPWWRRRAVAAGTAAALVAALGWGGYALFTGGDSDGGRAACPAPLELRLLTDPDIETTVRDAAKTYLTSSANLMGNECRRSGITTYSAGATDVIAAFRDKSAAWRKPTTDGDNPQRDIGPQPDIWIPAASADVARVRSENAVASLEPSESLASSPIVLAVPEDFARRQPGLRTGKKLGELVDAFRRSAPQAEVRRTDPEFTDAALLATMGLHGTAGSVSTSEGWVTDAGPPARTGQDLLCELPKAGPVDGRTAILLPEHLLKTGVTCESNTRVKRFAAYPVDVPGLDPSFVRVTWDGADRDREERNEAVERFQEWLTTGKGADAFREGGFRGPSQAGTVKGLLAPAAGTLPDPGTLTEPAKKAALDGTLKKYRDATGPGRVLFLLDSSWSMTDKWNGESGAPGILKQSLTGLGEEDEYGIWAVGDARDAYTALLPVQGHDRAAAVDRINKAALIRDVQADPYEALTAALDYLGGRGAGDDRPQLIVFITDDEDNDKLTAGDRLATLIAAAKDREVPVVMVSLEAGACAAGRPDARIAAASNGRCLDGTLSDLVSGLQDEVARTGSGDKK